MRQVILVRYFSTIRARLADKREPKRRQVDSAKDHVTNEASTMQTSTVVPPKDTKFIWVGPSHPVSNLRTIVYNESENESIVERNFRLARIKTQEWNQQFWEKHNSDFYQCREEFIKAKRKEIYGEEMKNNKPLTPDEMSKFYKKFLDEKYEIHLRYNEEWYKKNIGLLFPAIKVFFYQIWKKKLKF